MTKRKTKTKPKPAPKRGRPKNQDSLTEEWCGHSLRVRMTAAKLSTEELANIVGVSRPTLNAYINDRYTPTAECVDSLAEALGCTIADLSTPPKL